MIPDSATETRSSSRRKGGKNFLTNEMLTTQPKEAKITGTKYNKDGNFGPNVQLKLALDGETVYWTVSIEKNPNFPILKDRFGRNENDWTGNKILLHLEYDDYEEKYFPRVSFPEESKEVRRSRKSA